MRKISLVSILIIATMQEARMENNRERKAGRVRSGRASQKDTDRKP